jgi:hypothetical protein
MLLRIAAVILVLVSLAGAQKNSFEFKNGGLLYTVDPSPVQCVPAPPILTIAAKEYNIPTGLQICVESAKPIFGPIKLVTGSVVVWNDTGEVWFIVKSTDGPDWFERALNSSYVEGWWFKFYYNDDGMSVWQDSYMWSGENNPADVVPVSDFEFSERTQ